MWRRRESKRWVLLTIIERVGLIDRLLQDLTMNTGKEGDLKAVSAMLWLWELSFMDRGAKEWE